jgi:hypothetical protein
MSTDRYPNSRDEQLHMVKNMEHQFHNPRADIGCPSVPHNPTGKQRKSRPKPVKSGECYENQKGEYGGQWYRSLFLCKFSKNILKPSPN